MRRTFHLFKALGIEPIKYHLDPTKRDPDGKEPIIEGSEETPVMYNDICVVKDGSKPAHDPHNVEKKDESRGMLPSQVLKDDVDETLRKAFGFYKEKMAHDFNKGFDELLKVDHTSTRQYLIKRQNLDPFAIQWLETNATSTGLFDQAFTESVIDSFDFAAEDKDGVGTWYCIEGGAAHKLLLIRKKG